MLLIFDCDGTLVDSELIALDVLSLMMSEYGHPMPVAACLDAFMGLHNDDIIRKIERLIGRALPPGENGRMRERMLARMRTELKPVDGAAALLASLDGPRCVASSSDSTRIALCLELTGLASFFGAHIFSATEVSHGKPAPDLFLHAARIMGVAPHQCVVIEDSVAGVRAGVAAGMAVVGFAGASHVDAGHAAVLKAAGARAVVAAMSDVPDAIARVRHEAASL